MKTHHLIALSIGCLILIFAIAGYVYNQQQATIQTEQAATHSQALIQFHSPRAGNPNAKVTIVEFMDPACETCSQFHPLVKALMKKHDGKVNLVIRYAPFHHGSDYAVKILEAARKQGTYWGVMELMYETQNTWASHHQPQPELLWKYLEHYNFDVAGLKQNMNDPAIASIIAQDLADARQLGVNKTPSFFVNGKPLIHFGYQQLTTLVETAVEENYPKNSAQ